MSSLRRMFHNRPRAGLRVGSVSARDAMKVEFGRRLQDAMIKKGWNQSELARQAAKQMPDKNFPRDNISNYIRGRTFPQPQHVEALCRTLGVKREDLIPPDAYASVDEGPRPIVYQDLGNGKAHLLVDVEVSVAVALQIMGMLHKDEK